MQDTLFKMVWMGFPPHSFTKITGFLLNYYCSWRWQSTEVLIGIISSILKGIFIWLATTFGQSPPLCVHKGFPCLERFLMVFNELLIFASFLVGDALTWFSPSRKA